MARHYVIQDWQNAAEYSGEMIGRRLARSQEIFLPNGQANTALFADESPKKKKKSVADSIDLSNSHLERMERMSIELDEEYAVGDIDDERYTLLRYKMDERLIKAWRRVEKENTLVWDIEEIAPAYQPQPTNRDNQSNKSFTSDVHCSNLLINSLSNGNVFREAYLMFIKLRGMFNAKS